MTDNVERKSTNHKRDGRGRVMHPNSLKNLKKPRVKYRYITVVSSALALAIVALAVMMSVTTGMNASLANKLESQYQRSFYDLITNIDNIEQGQDVALNAQMAVVNLNALPINSENASESIALLNEVAQNGTEGKAEDIKNLRARFSQTEDMLNQGGRIVDNMNFENRKKNEADLDKLFAIESESL